MNDDGYKIENMSDKILPLRVTGASASMRVTGDDRGLIPCIFLDLGPDDEATNCIIMSVREARWLAEQIPGLCAAIDEHVSKIEQEVLEFRSELDD